MPRVDLPEGYRLLLSAPGVRVLVDVRSGGRVVARYRGRLDASMVKRDAEEDERAYHSGGQEEDHMPAPTEPGSQRERQAEQPGTYRYMITDKLPIHDQVRR